MRTSVSQLVAALLCFSALDLIVQFNCPSNFTYLPLASSWHCSFELAAITGKHTFTAYDHQDLTMAKKRARFSDGPKRSEAEATEIQHLDARLEHGGPGGLNSEVSFVSVRNFEDLPLSKRTKVGLKEHKFTRLTAVQRSALPFTLCGRDVLGAAKTGSGKTLTFLLPVCAAKHLSDVPASTSHIRCRCPAARSTAGALR